MEHFKKEPQFDKRILNMIQIFAKQLFLQKKYKHQ